MRLLIAANARLGLCRNAAASSARTANHAHCTDPGKLDMIQASSTCSPLFFRARISKMLSVWALVASRLTRPWHPYGHRWSHRTGPCTAPSSTPWLQRKHTQIQWVPMLTLCTASNLLRAVQSCLSEVHTFRWTGHLVSRDMAVCQRTNYRDVERMAQIAVRITR